MQPDVPMPELIDSVNALVQDHNAQELYDTLTAVAFLARVHPIALTEHADILNPLLTLNRNDPDAFLRVLDLVDDKRVQAGLEPLRKVQESTYDKTEYMRNFMDAKRQRQRRAAEIENMFRAEADRLVGRARLDFMDAQSAKWKAALDAYTRCSESEVLGGHRLRARRVRSLCPQGTVKASASPTAALQMKESPGDLPRCRGQSVKE